MPFHAVTAHRAQLGEGPFWDVDTQALYWVNIAGKQALCYEQIVQSFPITPYRIGTTQVITIYIRIIGTACKSQTFNGYMANLRLYAFGLFSSHSR